MRVAKPVAGSKTIGPTMPVALLGMTTLGICVRSMAPMKNSGGKVEQAVTPMHRTRSDSLPNLWSCE
ncbi:hypothetical protein D3C83_210180 [compost metagenome]